MDDRVGTLDDAVARRLADELAEVRIRLAEAEETLEAIRNGEVDAVVVGSPSGQLVYTLENADRPYRVLIEQMQEGAVTLGEDRTILYCNQRFLSLLDLSLETVLGRSIDHLFRVDDLAQFERMMRGDVGVARAGEFVLLSGKRHEIPVNISLVDLKLDDEGTRVVCGVVTDLTQNRRRAEELAAVNANLGSEIGERRRVEESLRLALDAAGMGNWEIDLVTGEGRRSRRYREIFGAGDDDVAWTREQAVAAFLPKDREFVRQAFVDVEVTGAMDFELRIHRESDDAIRGVNVLGRAYYEHGRAVQIAGVVSDVTDQRALEEQLRQAQKMEAVGQLTGGLAHDFNNLLTGISGNLEMLEIRTAQGRQGAALERYILAAKSSAKRAAALTHRLLAFARRQTLDPTAIDVNVLIHDMEDLLRRTIGPSCVLDVDSAPDLGPALVDGNQLESALLNLCINARDAMPDGGRITIRTAHEELDAKAAGERDLIAGPYLTISVIDTGTGMPPEVVARAFDPFFTTKPIGAGTGLGLSMVYGFARQSSGQVRIQSEVGRGTTLCIDLPRYGGDVEQHDIEVEALTSSVSARRETVLIIDDEPTVRMLVMEVLDDLNYQTIEAHDGVSGMKILQSSQHIDLLVTDVGLPGEINGRQVADAARALRPGLRILFITGYADSAVLEKQDLEAGMEVLTKPFALDALAHRITSMIASPRVDVAG